MLSLFRTTQFKKDYKKLNQKHKELTQSVLQLLAQNQKLPNKYRDHKLIDNFLGCRGCHIKPDLLLIYKINNNILELVLVRVGSHSELFKK
jgi:mRNA interferase YafQ